MTTAHAAISPDWLITGTPWTSGVLNETSAMPYHVDGNNLRAWSAMIVARRGITGGHLHIPEYDLTVECRDGDVIWFPGWQLMHGVTPITRRTPDGYRYTAVFYTVRGIAACLDPVEELARARAARSAREDRLMDHQTSAGLMD